MLALRARSLLVTVVLALPGFATAQVPVQGGTVTGYVWTANNSAIADAPLRLRDVVSGQVVQSTKATETGAFTFANVPPGQYVVELIFSNQPSVAMAVGHPFTLAAGETAATFVRISNALPILIQAASPMTFSAAAGWSQDMTQDNRRMSGGTIEAGFPIGSGGWIAVEGGFFQSTYPHPVYAPSHVRRVTFQVSGRVGNRNRHAVFGQATIGVWGQELDLEGLGGSRETAKFWSDDWTFTLGPGIGVDVPIGKRLSIVLLGEIQVVPQHPRDRWIHPKLSAGLTFRLPRD